ncbi:MAG: toll/interleukin-1 receptor domain-containing protein [Lachnospiraceae bacterium]|nr:toll/interleukin-1 receptor domain-containing protein [Lachnospiraceae bacterium]
MKSDETFRDNLEQALLSEENRPGEVCDGKIDVFLSYSSKNKNVADAVVAEFEQHGIRCWYAPRDIVPGQEWVSAIHDAITACSLFVLIYTDSSNESKQVANEVALAFNSGKTLIPFRLSDAEMSSELEYYLTRVHWLDAVNPPLRQSIESLRKYSERILKGEVPVESKIRNANTNGKNQSVNATGNNRNENAEGGTGERRDGWLYPALAVLAVAVVVAAVMLVIALKDKDKPSDGGDAVTPTGTAAAVTDAAEPTPSPEYNPKAQYEKAYNLQMSGEGRAVADEAYECYMSTGDALIGDEKIIDAMVALATYYYEEGATEDADKALALYRKAAACGSVKANNYLGNYYLEADREGKSDGSSRADTEYNGNLISKELREAIAYYEKSAENGDAIALYSLGLIFENENDSYTIEPDYVRALLYYEKAEQAGHANAAKARARVQEKLQDDAP